MLTNISELPSASSTSRIITADHICQIVASLWQRDCIGTRRIHFGGVTFKRGMNCSGDESRWMQPKAEEYICETKKKKKSQTVCGSDDTAWLKYLCLMFFFFFKYLVSSYHNVFLCLSFDEGLLQARLSKVKNLHINTHLQKCFYYVFRHIKCNSHSCVYMKRLHGEVRALPRAGCPLTGKLPLQ